MQVACVENVLDSVVMSLRRDPNRKFVFAEMVKLFYFYFLVTSALYSFVQILIRLVKRSVGATVNLFLCDL